jgi:CRP/FNR family transcriptional regulator, cyclic AMP receptor protein
MRTIPDLLAEQADLAGLPDADLELIAGCATNVVFKAGETLAREGEPAETFFVVRAGQVALDVAAPGAGPLRLLTLGPGELVGWSWLIPPHRWSSDVVAVAEVHAVLIDAACLRGKCEADPALGYRLMQRFAHITAERLQSTRLQLLDLYEARDARDA